MTVVVMLTGGGRVGLAMTCLMCGIEERRPKKPAPAPGMEEVEIEAEGVEEEGEEDLIEDADELEDDADTIGPEIEVEPDHDRTER